MTTPRDPIYAVHRYPAEIISYAVWLYFRFPLSLRMVEEMLAARGIIFSYRTVGAQTQPVVCQPDPSSPATDRPRSASNPSR